MRDVIPIGKLSLVIGIFLLCACDSMYNIYKYNIAYYLVKLSQLDYLYK